jgi:hypothetical protein
MQFQSIPVMDLKVHQIPFRFNMKVIQMNIMKVTCKMKAERTKNFNKGVHGVPHGSASINFS